MKKLIYIVCSVLIVVLVLCVVLDNFKINKLSELNTESNAELEKHKNLLSNLNDLLKCVYTGEAKNANYQSNGFTAFSLLYSQRYYIITAGHCINYRHDGINSGLYTDIKFKSNFSKSWIYPKLLFYDNDFENNRDWAILVYDKLTEGLAYNLEDNRPAFVLGNGNDNLLKNFNIYTLQDGESGSPVVNLNGEVMGIATGNFTDIDLVINAINNLK